MAITPYMSATIVSVSLLKCLSTCQQHAITVISGPSSLRCEPTRVRAAVESLIERGKWPRFEVRLTC